MPMISNKNNFIVFWTNFILIFFIILIFQKSAMAKTPTETGTTTILTMDQVVKQTKINSKSLQSSLAAADAANLNAESLEAGQLPRINFESNYRSQSVTPQVKVGSNIIKLSDSYNYSIGPSLSYTIWDGGLKKNSTLSLKSIAQAKIQLALLNEIQLKQQSQITYVQTALATEIVQLAEQAAELSQNQNKDIQDRYKTGAANRLESLAATTEIANYRFKIQQAKTDLDASLEDLKYLLGPNYFANQNFESLDELMQKFSAQNSYQKQLLVPSKNHPLLQMHIDLERAYLAQADSVRASQWPIINLQLKSSLDYPNGPQFEQIYQNTLGLNLTWSLFDFGTKQKEIEAKLSEARIETYNKEETMASINRDLKKAITKLKNIAEQIDEMVRILSSLEELARLNYSTYKYGKLSYSEVQNANIRLLETKNRLATIRAQYLIQYFNIEFLSESESL